MSMNARLKKLESAVLKSGAYVTGMKIMEQIAQANETDNGQDKLELMMKLYNNSKKSSANRHYKQPY